MPPGRSPDPSAAPGHGSPHAGSQAGTGGLGTGEEFGEAWGRERTTLDEERILQGDTRVECCNLPGASMKATLLFLVVIAVPFRASTWMPDQPPPQQAVRTVTQPPSKSLTKPTTEALFRAASKSIVVVHAKNTKTNESQQGSGIVIRKNTVVTNKHVLEGCDLFWISVGNRNWGIVTNEIKVDPERDLALIPVEDLGLPALRINSNLPAIGEKIYSIGNPKGLENTIADGIVSGLRGGKTKDLIQFTSPISSGSSGGGLINEWGQLLGITTFMFTDGQNLNFALPIKWVTEAESRSVDYKDTAAITKSKFTEANYNEASQELSKKEDYKKMVEISSMWISEYPNSPEAYKTASFAQFMTDNKKLSVDYAKKACELAPNDSSAFGMLGIVYEGLGEKDLAINTYRKSLEINSANKASRNSLSNLLTDKGHFERNLGNKIAAQRFYQEAVRLNEENAFAWFQIAFEHADQGRYQEAVNSYLRVIQIQPKNVMAHYNLGFSYVGLGDQKTATDVCYRLRLLDQSKADELWQLIEKRFNLR